MSCFKNTGNVLIEDSYKNPPPCHQSPRSVYSTHAVLRTSHVYLVPGGDSMFIIMLHATIRRVNTQRPWLKSIHLARDTSVTPARYHLHRYEWHHILYYLRKSTCLISKIWNPLSCNFLQHKGTPTARNASMAGALLIYSTSPHPVPMSVPPPTVLETLTNPTTTTSSRSNSSPTPPTPDSLFVAAEQGLLYSELLAEELELRKQRSQHPLTT